MRDGGGSWGIVFFFFLFLMGMAVGSVGVKR